MPRQRVQGSQKCCLYTVNPTCCSYRWQFQSQYCPCPPSKQFSARSRQLIEVAFAEDDQESTTGEIDLEDDEPDIVALLIDFLYKSYYNDGRIQLHFQDVISTANPAVSFPKDASALRQCISTGMASTTPATVVSFQQPSTTGIFNTGTTSSNATSNQTLSSQASNSFNFGSLRTSNGSSNLANGPQTSPRSSFGLEEPYISMDLEHLLEISQPDTFESIILAPLPNTPTTYHQSAPTSLFGSSINTTSSTNPVPPPNSSRSLFDFKSKPIVNTTQSKALLVNAKVYVIAEKYDIPQLKRLARHKYEEVLLEAWNSSEFVESLRLIYEGIPEQPKVDELWQVAMKTAGKHAKELLDRGEFLSLCKEKGEVATDILKASLGTM